MIRVFLADDHPVVRAGLRMLVSLESDIEITGEAGDGGKVLQAASQPDFAVDVLVLDLSLPTVDGIEVLRRLHESHPALHVLVLSMHSEKQYAQQLIAMGAAGYVSKDHAEVDLVTAIRTVAQGRLYVRRHLDRLNGPGLAAPVPSHQTLSARQTQVFRLIVAGRSVSQVAAELDVAVSTVSTHLGLVKEKLGVRSVAELVSYAHRMSLA